MSDTEQAGLPADIPVTVVVGEGVPEEIGTLGLVLVPVATADGAITLGPSDPDNAGQQLAYLLESAAADLRAKHGGTAGAQPE